MNTEIERKYLLEDTLAFLTLDAESTNVIVQDYLDDYKGMLVRASHMLTLGQYKRNSYYLSLKSKNEGLTRTEINTNISHDAYVGWLGLGRTKQVVKVRKKFMYDGKLWEVDYFTKPHGLLMAEIELESEDETFRLPTEWLGPMKEVTGQKKYYNYDMAVPNED